LLEAAPLFAFTAPQARSGKTLLAEIAAIISTGKPAPASSVSTDREEFRKMLTSTLREGHAIVNLDNVGIGHDLKSDDLAKILTQEEFSDRILGESTKLSWPTNITWTTTGNGLVIRGDLAIRTLACEIDPKTEHPEQRTFKIPNLKAHVAERRREFVGAAMTILKAYKLSKEKEAPEPWGGFESWSSEVREPMLWLGMADPCEKLKSTIDEDPEKESAIAVLSALAETFGVEEFTSSDVIKRAEKRTVLGAFENEELRNALLAVAKNKDELDLAKFGRWARSWRNRIAGAKRLERFGHAMGGVAKWRVVTIEESTPKKP
jgi:putative DNA primase/helicase